MPNQDRDFVIVHPKLSARHTFSGHNPLQAANKAYTHLRKNKRGVGKGKYTFSIREVRTDKVLTYTGTHEKLKKPIVITHKDGSTVNHEYKNVVHRVRSE